jgi:exosortase
VSIAQVLERPQAVTPGTATVGEWARQQKWALLATAAMVAFIYAPNFVKLFSDWRTDENYSHGFIVPFVFAWLLWERRKQLAACDRAPRTWALLFVAFALLQLYAGRLGAEYFVSHTSLLVLLAGLALYLCGRELLRLVLFPLGWLLFMIPLPAIIYYAITFPLQLFASRMASRFLDLLAVPNLREGNVIYLPHFSMGVAEACSGIRSLVSLLAFAVLFGHLFRLRVAWRWVLAASAIPFALVINAVRVAGTGLAGNYLGARYAEGFYHLFAGWLLFVTGLVVMLGLGGMLRRLNRPRGVHA